MTMEWDCLVVGAGIVGSWTAYHLATAGQRTLLLEQFMLPHTRGSSGGQTRVMCKVYTPDGYGQLTKDSYFWWQKLEQNAGVTLFKKTGLLLLQEGTEPGHVDENETLMDKHKFPFKLLQRGSIQSYYPTLKFSENYKGLIDTDAGALVPVRCLAAVQNEFKRLGGTLQDGEKVEDIIPGSPVRVKTSRGSYSAKKVVIAAGPWSKDIIIKTGIDVPIKTMPGLSVFFSEKDPTNPRYSVHQGFPMIVHYLYSRPDSYRFVLIFPSIEYPGMIKMVTRGEPTHSYCHPDERDTRGSQDMVDILVQYVKDHLPGIDPTPKIMEPCLYTMTPDQEYIIDKHPNCDNIFMAAGMSGKGFVRAPNIGILLKEMVLGLPPSYVIEPFKLDRFEKNITSRL